jgi:6-phosphogluconolactonase
VRRRARVVQCEGLPIETIVAPPIALARAFAQRLAAAARLARAQQRSLSLVVPGGSVAEQFFPVLAAADIDWAPVELLWGDERAVGAHDSDSNYRAAADLLLPKIALDPAHVHRMPADTADLTAAARAYESTIERVRGRGGRLDIVLLGVGPDGHVCSLFPGHPALDERSHLVVRITDSPKPPPRRLTLTLPALEGADIYVAAFGAAKAEAMREVVLSPTSRLPVALAARGGRRTVFLLDAEAAGGL